MLQPVRIFRVIGRVSTVAGVFIAQEIDWRRVTTHFVNR
jgi:hypothetical protein